MFERYSYPSRQVIFLIGVIAAHVQAKAIEASHLTGALIIGDQRIRIAERLGAASFGLSYLSGFKRPMWPSLLTRELADALLDSVGLRFSMPHLPTSEDIPVSEEVSSVSVLQQRCRVPARQWNRTIFGSDSCGRAA